MPTKIKRDTSKAVFFRCSQRTYDALCRYAAEQELNLAGAVIQMIKGAVERHERREKERSAA